LGYKVIVAHAQKVQLITKSNRKDDRHDARTLARLARIDPELLRPVRHRSAQAQIHLTVIRAPAELVSARTAHNHWFLPACQRLYLTQEGPIVSQGTPLLSGTADVPKFNRDALVAALRTDQAGKSTFPEFLLACWHAGVVRYDVDFTARTCTSFGCDGEKYIEDYPEVAID
jgi:uncharacterized protein YbcV (DUF1398 family)